MSAKEEVTTNNKRRISSSENKDYKCSICSKLYRTKGILNTHIKNVHEHLRPFKCLMCSKQFAAKAHLDVHVQTVHEQIKSFWKLKGKKVSL